MQVLKLSKFLLVQTAAEAAIIRLLKSTYLPEEVECMMNWYFEHQQHCSIGEFLQYELECSPHREIFMQVYYRGSLPEARVGGHGCSIVCWFVCVFVMSESAYLDATALRLQHG